MLLDTVASSSRRTDDGDPGILRPLRRSGRVPGRGTDRSATGEELGDSAVDNMIEGNRIAQNTSIQVGLPNNQWPPAVQKDVYAPPGSSALDDLRGAIADGTTLDGDKSDWEIGNTTVAAP
ncbi:hypothetical protein [Nocardia asteroides]|uniref:hypothetical protein n=1 Tax=Nocardia asteroides TaxID=1824 RepID=UPI001E5795FD|nr:hypothetical protein [Nocardia asteroides]UGT60869.1 hypothetical protein LTT61_27580 [Nocardia asteroides]